MKIWQNLELELRAQNMSEEDIHLYILEESHLQNIYDDVIEGPMPEITTSNLNAEVPDDFPF